MKTNTINNDQVKNVNECELSENELEQVNGGFSGYTKACLGGVMYGVGCILIGTGVAAPIGAGLCVYGGKTVFEGWDEATD